MNAKRGSLNIFVMVHGSLVSDHSQNIEILRVLNSSVIVVRQIFTTVKIFSVF